MVIFGEKSSGGAEKWFSSTDLIDHVEFLVKVSINKRLQSDTTSHNYGWLRSRAVNLNGHDHARTLSNEMAALKPIIWKMNPEDLATVAVKLDRRVEETQTITPDAILNYLKTLLEEQSNLQLMKKSVKEMKNRSRIFNRRNRVTPELTAGRQATVSFVMDVEYITVSKF